MAQADSSKAIEVAYLHMRIVRNVVRNLLQFIVRQANQQWTLDEYIEANGDQILQTQLAMRHRPILFPRHREVTIESLPLYLIEHLITDIPQCFVVPRDIRDAIREINQIRRESNSAIVTGVDETIFENQVEKIQQLLTTICRFMNNTTVLLETQRYIGSLRQPIFITDETVLDEFKKHYEQEKSHRKAVNCITNDQSTLHRLLVNAVSIRDGNASDAANVCSRDGKDVVIEMDPGNAGMSRDLVNVINNEEDSDESNPLRERGEEIRSTFTNTFSYYGDFYARQGCVQICVKPRSIKLLFELLEDCVNGELTKKLKPAEESIRRITSFENYKQEAVLYQDHYDSVLTDIASQIRQQLEDRGLTVANESAVPKVELSTKGTILIRVPCPSVDERDKFKNTFKSGQMDDSIKSLQGLLRDAYGEPDVSLKAKVEDITNTTTEIPGQYAHTHDENKMLECSAPLDDTGSFSRQENEESPGIDRSLAVVGESVEAVGSEKVEDLLSKRLADSTRVMGIVSEKLGGKVGETVGVMVGSIINNRVDIYNGVKELAK